MVQGVPREELAGVQEVKKANEVEEVREARRMHLI